MPGLHGVCQLGEARARRARGDDSPTMFASRAYRLIVLAEVVAAVLGLATGLVTGSTAAVLAVTALISSAVLLAAGAWTLLAARRVPR